jgi:hypothetical protein
MTASQMRRLIDAISIREDEFVMLCIQTDSRFPLRQPLRESFRKNALMEGPLLDKVRKTANIIKAKYDDIQYSMLAKATVKALDLFQSSGDVDPKVASVIAKIGKIGKGAAQNRALLLVLMGMVGTLIGLASNPASAQTAAAQMDQSLSGSLDQLVDTVTGGDAAAVANAAQAANPNTIQNVLQFNPTRVPSANGAINLESIAMQDETGVIGGPQRWQRFTNAINDNQGRLTSYTRHSPEVMNAVSRVAAEVPMPNISNYQIDVTLRNPEGFQRYTSDVASYFHNLTRFAKATLDQNEDMAQMQLRILRGLRR